jgi:hypothetical protein
MDNHDLAILLVYSSGYKEFLVNILRNFEEISIPDITVKILAPPSQLSELVKIKDKSFLNITIEPNIHLDQIFSDGNRAFDFDTASFNLTMQQKVLFIERSLREYKYVIYSDLDVAWLRNPLPLLLEILKEFDFAFQSEVQASAKPVLCFGFAAIRSTIFSRFLFKKLSKLVTSGSAAKPIVDQVVLNEFYNENRLFRKRLFPLSEGLFPNGLLYKIFVKNEDDHLLANQLQPFIYHANFLVGTTEKANFLSKYADWDFELK